MQFFGKVFVCKFDSAVVVPWITSASVLTPLDRCPSLKWRGTQKSAAKRRVGPRVVGIWISVWVSVGLRLGPAVARRRRCLSVALQCGAAPLEELVPVVAMEGPRDVPVGRLHVAEVPRR